MDKRVFALGVTMLAIGGLVWFYFNNTIPMATPGMSQDELNTFYQAESLSIGLRDISGMLAGLGFFIVLISVGLKRRQKDGVGKSITQKPAQT